MTEQEKSYQELPKENETTEAIQSLRDEVKSTSIPLNLGKLTSLFLVSLKNEIELDNTTEISTENKDSLIKELEKRFQFRPESTEKIDLNGKGVFTPENNDFFYIGDGEPNGPGSVFFSTNQNEGDTNILKKIQLFNLKVQSEKSSIGTIDISPKFFGEKINTFLKNMQNYYLGKIKKQDWESLEENFIPTYKYISKSEREKDSLGKKGCIILLISQERELFDKAQILTNSLPKEVKENTSFDFKPLLKKYDSLLENLSKDAPKETEEQKIQAISIFVKRQEYDTSIAKIFDKLYEGNKSPEEALEKAKNDWFLSFFLNHPDKNFAKIWEKKIKSWQLKKDLKIYYDGLHRDDTRIFISILQYQIFGREEKEKINGKVANLFPGEFYQIAKN